jgi:hypothetical protein
MKAAPLDPEWVYRQTYPATSGTGDETFRELADRHPGEFIALHGGVCVASARTLEGLVRQLQSSGLDLAGVDEVAFVSTAKRLLL